MTLNERLEFLEKELVAMKNKVADLSKNTEEKVITPISTVGGTTNRGIINPVDIKAGLGLSNGGAIIWNTSELGNPPSNVEPPIPNTYTGKGYNKHTHSRFSGGALLKDALEIVEYDYGSIVNKHSQQFWQIQPNIKKASTSGTNPQQVDMIGLLDLIFNADTQTWGVAAYEIDIKKCYLVERDNDGNIAVDSNGVQKRSLLYNTDSTKTSLVWDENAACFRFYAVYAEGTA